MPGPAVTVEVRGDTSGLDASLTESQSGFSKFKGGIKDLLWEVGGVTGAIALAAEGFGKLVELGGPEAQAALGKVQSEFSEALAPALAELTPLIVDMVEGLGELLRVVLPLLIPLIGLLATALGVVFGWIGSLYTAIKDLITKGLDILWEKLDAVRGMFDLVWGVIETVIGWFNSLTTPIDNVIGSISGFLDLVGQAIALVDELLNKPAPQDTASWQYGGAPYDPSNPYGRSGGGTSITVNTGADPGAVMRAQRRYIRLNGGAGIMGRRGVQVRGW